MTPEDFTSWSSQSESERDAKRTALADIIKTYYSVDPEDCMTTMERAGVIPDPRTSGGD